MVIRHALLALLSEGPKHGFQLAQEFEARTGEVWPLNTGQVYTTLQRLERDELVESDDTPENGAQNRYRLTEAGRAELEVWLHSPPDTASPPRDELVIKVLVALRVPDVDVAELTQTYRRHVIQAMQEYTRAEGRRSTRTTRASSSLPTRRSIASTPLCDGSTRPRRASAECP